MKKLLLGVFVGLLILAVTAPVWALEVTVGGEFRFRARDRSNFDLQAYNLNRGVGNPAGFVATDAPMSAASYTGRAYATTVLGGTPAGILLRPGSTSHMFEGAIPHADRLNNDRNYVYDRIRVSIDAKIVEGLRAYVMFENYSDWGISRGNQPAWNVPQVYGSDGSAGIYGDRQGVNIRFAWVDFVIPKTPVHVKIGRQPLAIGHGILLDTRTWGGDMAYVYAPIGPVTVGAFYGKFLEINRSNEDDASFAGAHLDFAINPSNKVSTFYRLAWARTTRQYAYGDITDGDAGTMPFLPPGIGGGPTGGLGFVGFLNAQSRNQASESNQHGWGIAFDGRIPLGKVGLFYAAEADILWGNYRDYIEPRRYKRWGSAAARFQEDLYQVAWGYGVQLGVDFKFVQLDIAHSFGSGDRTRAMNYPTSAYTTSSGGAGHRLHQWTTGRRVEAFDAIGGDGAYSPWTTDIFMTSTKSANYGGTGLGTPGFTRGWGYGSEIGDIILLKPTLVVRPLDNLTADVSYAVFWKATNTNTHGAQWGTTGTSAFPPTAFPFGDVGRVVDGESTAPILWVGNGNNREQINKQKINRFLGQEIDAHITYYPYKNLMIKGWAGVFFPGEWFKAQQRSHNYMGAGAPDKGMDSVNLRPAWALQLDVIVTF